MKKRIWLYLGLFCLCGAVAVGGWYKKQQQLKESTSSLWISTRPLPEKVALSAYLAGNYARTSHHLSDAVDAYLKVLEKDPENTSLIKDVYLLAMIQGTSQKVMPYVSSLEEETLFSEYARAADSFQKGDLKEARSILQHQKQTNADALLKPLLKAWINVKEGKKEQAVAEIEKMNQEPFLVGYQKVLIGKYFQDNDLIQKGIFQMGDHDLLAVGYFPLLKQEIDQVGNWSQSAMNKKYQELGQSYPATADILQYAGQTHLTPETGLAEAFYLVSALGGRGKLSREESLILNSLALFLQPDKQISLIWGAELSEGLELPKIALSYYKQIKAPSATIAFKEAADMILADQAEEGLARLEKLEKTNQTSIPLLTLMASVYQEQNQKEKALAIYNRLIPLLEEKPSNPPLIQAYAARALLYGPERPQEMLDDLKKAQILDPENAMLLNDLGYHQLEMGQVQEGFDLVQKAYFKQPNDPYILDSMAFGYWKTGQSELALPLAEKALDLMPQSALINAHLGDIYDQMGRHREARFQYKKALDLKTDLPSQLMHEISLKLEGESK